MLVLLLNNSYEPLKTITWQKAMVLFCNDKIEIIETYKDRKITSPQRCFSYPAVARLLTRVSWVRKEVKFSRHNVYLRDKHQCQYCGKEHSPNYLTFDHILPKSRGGLTTWKNIVTACKRCNQKKGNQTPEEARMPLLSKPHIPKNLYKKSQMPMQAEVWKNYIF